jgi:protein O-GlcNAc transferase
VPASLSVESRLVQAIALLRARRHDDAHRMLAEIIAGAPEHAAARFMLGVAEAELRNFPAAIEHVGRALALAPEQLAPNRLVFANILLDAGEPARAQAEAREFLRHAPRSAPALNVLGVALHRLGRVDEAIAAYGAAIACDADLATAHRNLAAALAAADRLGEAIAAQRRVIALHPADAPDHLQLARLQHRDARVFDAIDGYRHALSLDASDADAWNELANALTDAGLLAAAQGAYREALRLRPDYSQVESTLLINFHYDPAFDAAQMFAAHREWAARHAAGLAPPVAPRARALAAGERLRVGFLSPAFREGPTSAFVAPLFEHLDRTRFELFAYNANGRRDAKTDDLQRRADHWHDAWTEDDAALADRIRADAVDILVDLAGHVPGGRPLALARKPAPVIATWLDYFDTTGLDAVDYLIGDATSTPEGGPQRFTEQVVRLQPCRLCYSPPAHAPQVAAAPLLRKGYVTFGSFNRLSKLAPPVLALWATLLRDIASSRLVLKNGAFADRRTRELLMLAFAERGVAAERIELRPHSTHAQMLAEYGDIDIALDPFPYNGGLTTCEALWMGVPVLTLLGNSMVSRQSASLVRAAGLPEWVARDPAELLRLAAQAAADGPALAALRAGMRTRLRASPLLDAPRFAREFEAALQCMWERSAAHTR